MVCNRIFTYINQSIAYAILAILMVYLPFYRQGAQNAYLLSERFFFVIPLIYALLVTTLAYRIFETKTTYKNLSINVLDITVVFYFAYCLFSYFQIAGYNGTSGKLIEIYLLAALYVGLRLSNKHIHRAIIYLLIISVSCQAFYGLLQLYGFRPSNHGMFKLTGGFFNPGPYGGYLAAIWPVVLGIYLFRNSFNISLSGSKTLYGLRNHPAIKRIQSKVQNGLKWFKIVIIPLDKTISNHLKPSQTTSNKTKPAPNTQHQAPDSYRDSNQYPAPSTRHLTTIPSNYLPFAALVLMLLVLPATRSRAAWISVLGTTVFLIAMRYNIIASVKQKLTSNKLFYLSTITAILIFGFSAWGIYHFKKDSANGRMLIWKASLPMVADNPITGVGYGKYAAHYMPYQAAYLKGRENTPEAQLAGETNYAYNTLLKLTTELGFIGSLLITGIFTYLFTSLKLFRIISNQQPAPSNKYPAPDSYRDSTQHPTPSTKHPAPSTQQPATSTQHLVTSTQLLATLGLTGLLIFSLFSYPEHILVLKILFVILLAISASSIELRHTERSRSERSRSTTFIYKAFFLLLLAFTIAFTPQLNKTYKQYKQAYTNWQNANTMYQIGEYAASLEDYAKAYPTLKNNGNFLLNYGKALSMAGQHQKAIEILHETEKHLKNTIVYTALGDSYKALNMATEAEQAYLYARQILPSRFYAPYLLAKLYNETGQTQKAQQIAKEIMNKQIKIPSTAVEEIKLEIRKIMLNNLPTN